jgi:hypothetical protein
MGEDLGISNSLGATMFQSKSVFLRMPLEMRNNIYFYILPSDIHVCVRDGKLSISKCLEPHQNIRSSNFAQETDMITYDGSERAPIWEDQKWASREKEWARRLRSTWGPHWMCDGIVGPGTVMDIALLLVCKTMYAVPTLPIE